VRTVHLIVCVQYVRWWVLQSGGELRLDLYVSIATLPLLRTETPALPLPRHTSHRVRTVRFVSKPRRRRHVEEHVFFGGERVQSVGAD
jgi:hypothetical protein